MLKIGDTLNLPEYGERGGFKLGAACLLFFFVTMSMGCATTTYQNPLYSRANDAYERSDYTTAVSAYDQFIKENPDSVMVEVALYKMGESYQKSGNKEKAKEVFGKLIAKYKTGFWVSCAKENLASIQ